ncbi:plant expansin [Coniophora puteana RWD-64-598 SS2]|uniref:Plant expansin n=1 Tax=Coniophora puteana (strain RWD-64-598) TaxID=741705 RepID=R7SDV1_CONPW|nr:plant expansin [Coniophora puteana RWD-64-598 SS2]EIW74050.1 plant expansin [Coniophora puteana RWD-64-598 SS2]
MFAKGFATLALALSASAMAVPFGKRQTPTSTSSAPASTSTLPAWLVGTQSGDGTFFNPATGACGIVNTDSDFIVAVADQLFNNFPGFMPGSNPNLNPICGKNITASYGGKNVTVSVTDRCGGCQMTDLDFTPAAFSVLADQSLGRIHDVEWVWDDLSL